MTRRFIPAALALLALGAAPMVSRAQSAEEHVAAGDKAFEARNAPEALREYEAALAADPKSYAALWKAARSDVDLGEYDPNESHRTALFETAEQRARAAVQLTPTDAEGHFTLARALGRRALSLGVRDRIKYAKEIRNQALACLKIDPKHPGCLHVLGVWNAEVMRLNGFSRMMAKTFLGGAVFGEASWGEAERNLAAAVANDPRRIVHRLDLGRVYADEGKKAQAREQLQAVVDGELIDYNDPHYKSEAARALKKL